MRIIGGKYRGRKFRAPAKLPVRPTTDFAREGLFNMLENSLLWPEIHMLDLFTGIGSIALEAASRGAARVVAVDRHGPNIGWLRKQVELLQEKNIELVKSDAITYAQHHTSEFNLVFADPPYDFDHYDALIEVVLTRLQQDAVFILEHRKSNHFDQHPNFGREKSYGEVAFTFFHK